MEAGSMQTNGKDSNLRKRMKLKSSANFSIEKSGKTVIAVIKESDLWFASFTINPTSDTISNRETV
jgi:hypothetical protein